MGLNFNELFPTWKCNAEEFHELFKVGSALTVERIETRKDSRNARQSEDGDQFAVCYFEELKKPISLNKTNAKVIMQLADSANTDDWAGTVVFVVAQPYEYVDDHGDRQHTWVFRLYEPKANAIPELQPKSDLTKLVAAKRRKELQAPPKRDAATVGIGFDKAVSMFAYMRARNKEWADVLAFAAANGMSKQMEARIPPELSEGARNVARLYLESLPPTKDVNMDRLKEELRGLWYPPVTEVIDKATGEVIKPVTPPDFDPDDIPF